MRAAACCASSALVEQVGAGEERDVAGWASCAGGVLEAEAAHLLGRGADEDDAAALAVVGEVGVFAEESVAGMDGLGAGFGGGFEDLIAAEIALGGGRGADADGFAGGGDVQGMGVGLGIDGDGGDAEAIEGANDAAGDFAAVGDQDFFEHEAQLTASAGYPSVTITRIGVGLKPLQGLLICGQLLMTTSVSISASRSTYFPGR